MKLLTPLFFLCMIFSFRCSPSPTIQTFRTDLIMFDKQYYPPTNSTQVIIYNSRLDIPHKYYDIGTIKYTGEPILDEIRELGASKGADGIVRDGNNFILIKFQKDREEKSNESKTI